MVSVKVSGHRKIWMKPKYRFPHSETTFSQVISRTFSKCCVELPHRSVLSVKGNPLLAHPRGSCKPLKTENLFLDTCRARRAVWLLPALSSQSRPWRQLQHKNYQQPLTTKRFPVETDPFFLRLLFHTSPTNNSQISFSPCTILSVVPKFTDSSVCMTL